jgi:pimeloyl-ACP methyl ester carboxylesterase
LKPVNDLEDEKILFFNPAYQDSVSAAEKSHQRIASRKQGLSPAMTQSQWLQMISIKDYSSNKFGTFEKMRNLKIPLLVIVGDNDISFPAQDWLKLQGQLPSAELWLLPRTGHALNISFQNELRVTFLRF